MADRIPFLVFGDGPRLSSGLARIARDLTVRLHLEQEELGIRLAQVGIDSGSGWHWQGWDFYAFQESFSDRGRTAVETAAAELQLECDGNLPIVLMITDPARGYDMTRMSDTPLGVETLLDCSFWGYFPIDAENREGSIGGPAAECIGGVDLLMAYGRYGATVMREVTGAPVTYLPHGIDTRVFHPGTPLVLADDDFQQWTDVLPSGVLKIGAVATNQPRKDLGLFFSTVAELKAQGIPVACWLQTDLLTKVWDIGELVRTCHLTRAEVFVSVEEITDQELAARYCWSDVTIAPGLGEGFGYPIVESLACGVPCVHINYAGGADLIPDPTWLVEPCAWRLESVYALLRPVVDPKDMAAAIVCVLHDRNRRGPLILAAYCSGSVAHLDWEYLWPRWRSAIRKGLRDHGLRIENERESLREVEET